MADVEEKIRGFLKEIKANKKKFKVKISVVLKKLEDYLFETKPKFNDNHIKLILLGDSEHDQQGLLHLCGTKGRGASKFKKSAYYALKILLRLLEEHPQREDVITFFTDLEDDEFPMIKLGLHIQISDPEKNEETPYRVCKVIYERRRFLSLDVYIEGKDNQIKFAKWYEQTKKESKEKDHDEPETWEREEARGKDGYQGPDLEEEAAKKFESLTKKRRQNVAEFDELNYDRDHDFFMKTFQDPMISKQKAEEYSFALALKGKKKRGKKKGKKDANIPYIADRDTAEFKKIIEELHIDSEAFDPFVLLETFHSKTPHELMSQAIEKVEEDIVNQKEYKENLMIFYVNEFAKCERILGRIQETFLIPESNPAKGMTTDIIHKIEEVYDKLVKIAEPVFAPKKEADKVRTCLFVYEKLKHIITWPEEMKECLVKKNLTPIIKNYSNYIACLGQYGNLPIFRETFEEVQKLTREVHKQILDFITIREKKDTVILEAVKNLYITNYPSEPIDTALQRLFDEIGGFISNYFSSTSSSVPRENVELYTNRKSVYLQSVQSIQDEETNYHYKSLGDLYEDGDGLTEYLDNYVEFKDERKTKKFYFQKKNLENFIQDFLDSVDLFYSILAALKGGELHEYFDANDVKSEPKAIEQCQQCINDIWNSLFNNIQSYVDYSAKLLGTKKRSVKKTLHNDLLSLGKSLARVDEYLMEKHVKREEFRALKLKTIELFLKEIHNSFITEELAKIKYREKNYLQQDFEGHSYSEFMNDITAALEKNISSIQNLSVFQGFEPAKGKILANYFASIFMNFIKIMRKRLVEDDKNSSSANNNNVSSSSNNSINILVTLTNLIFMVEFYFSQMANKYCSDLNIYEEDDFKAAIIEKLRQFFQEQMAEVKQLYTENKKDAMKDVLQESLLSEFIDKKKGKFIYESKFTEIFKQFVLLEKEFPQIRFYVFDLLAQLVMAYDELVNYAAYAKDELLKLIVEKTCSVLVNAVKIVLMQSKNIDELKQLWYEIEFFQNVTSKFQTEKSEGILKTVYKDIAKKKAEIEKVEAKDVEMFTAGEIATKKILIVKTKFKFQKQFEVLYI